MIRVPLRFSAPLMLLSLFLLAAVPGLVASIGGIAREVAEICRVGVLAQTDPLASVRGPLGYVPLALLAAGLTVAIADRLWQQIRLRSFLSAHTTTRSLRQDDPIYGAACRLQVDGRVEVIEGPGLPAFVIGFFRPRIFVSANLFAALSGAELEAMLRHEVEHLRRWDPMRFAVIRFAERALFWVPAASALAARAVADVEARADDAAAAVGRLELASAIVKTARLCRPAPETVAALHQTTATWRVRRLLGDATALPANHSSRIAASLILLGVLWAGALLGRPLGAHTTAPCNTCVLREQIVRQPDAAALHGGGGPPAARAPVERVPPE